MSNKVYAMPNVATPSTPVKIDPDKCIGCTKCARNCPVDAISGAVRQPHTIDTSKCIKCGTCVAGCPQNAIEEV